MFGGFKEVTEDFEDYSYGPCWVVGKSEFKYSVPSQDRDVKELMSVVILADPRPGKVFPHDAIFVGRVEGSRVLLWHCSGAETPSETYIGFSCTVKPTDWTEVIRLIEQATLAGS